MATITTSTSNKPLPLETTIQELPEELLQIIIFLTGEKNQQNTRRVSRHWNVQTFKATKFPIQQDLQQLFQLLANHLDQEKYPGLLAELAQIQDTYKLSIAPMKIPKQLQLLFLKTKVNIEDLLKKLTQEEQNKLRKAISHQIPESLSDIFKFESDLAPIVAPS